jgi:hypothetical protein
VPPEARGHHGADPADEDERRQSPEVRVMLDEVDDRLDAHGEKRTAGQGGRGLMLQSAQAGVGIRLVAFELLTADQRTPAFGAGPATLHLGSGIGLAAGATEKLSRLERRGGRRGCHSEVRFFDAMRSEDGVQGGWMLLWML